MKWNEVADKLYAIGKLRKEGDEYYMHLGYTDIQAALESYCGSSGDAITSLELKNILRGQGFWAEQEQVSRVLRELVEDGAMEYSRNGDHNLYRFTEDFLDFVSDSKAGSVITADDLNESDLELDDLDSDSDLSQEPCGVTVMFVS